LFLIEIPIRLKEVFPVSEYKVKASIGKGRITKCPWIAIMHNQETTTTQKGVYLVFLLSRDLRKIYLQLGQGVTKSNNETIIEIREKARSVLNLQNEYLRHFNNQEIDDEEYKACSIYANEWNLDDDEYCEKLLQEFKKAYEAFMNNRLKIVGHENVNIVSEPAIPKETKKKASLNLDLEKLISYIRSTGLIYNDDFIKRFAYSLLTKPFVILSGLAGSGKTQLALAFAKALVENEDEQLCFVPVGADWTNREPLLGYPNALKQEDYVPPESGALDLLIECNKEKNAGKPYFLILDEMNLSYVERYFADFLSIMESHKEIHLWKEKKHKVPPCVKLTKNLFIIGTINVDETTYMFSPKVLDRANVIEFKVDEDDMKLFLKSNPNVDIKKVCGKASPMAADFVHMAGEKVAPSTIANETLNRFFIQLKKVNAEFGYRTATEIGRFISLAIGSMGKDKAIDAAIVQKLMPKLHGSRKKIVPVLKELWTLCGAPIDIEEMEVLEIPEDVKFPLTANKILRMYKCAIDNGFTSFAEA
jgi:5-methylcytosine-specific restriction protein B